MYTSTYKIYATYRAAAPGICMHFVCIGIHMSICFDVLEYTFDMCCINLLYFMLQK